MNLPIPAPLTKDDFVDILKDVHFDPVYCRTLAACLAYHGQSATIPELVGVARIPARTLSYQLSALRCAGIITAKRGKNKLGTIIVHQPAAWGTNSAAYCAAKTGTESPISNLQSPISNPPAVTEAEIDEKLPPMLRQPVTPATVTRDYSAEIKILDSHPVLSGRIKVSWLAYLERKHGDQLAAAKTSLIALCDSFVHEFLGQSHGIAARRLADPKTNWENSLQIHVLRTVAPHELRRKAVPINTGDTPKPKQVSFRFRQRPDVPTSHPLPARSRPATDIPSGATPTLASAALADPILGKLLTTKPGDKP